MNKMERDLIKNLKTNLKMDFKFDEQEAYDKVVITCDNKCRLLSHLFHRAGLEQIHCTNQGEFEILYSELEYGRDSLFEALYDIHKNSTLWLVEYVEKYIDNSFMLNSTFGKKPEVETTN